MMLAEIRDTTYHLLAAFFGMALALLIVTGIVIGGVFMLYWISRAFGRVKPSGAAELVKDKG